MSSNSNVKLDNLGILNPLFRVLEHLCELGLPGALRRLLHVLPARVQGQRHQDALVPGGGGRIEKSRSSLVVVCKQYS